MAGVIKTNAALITDIDTVLATGQAAGAITAARDRQLMEDVAVTMAALTSVSALQYATGDGVTNDTAAFATAIAAAAGGILFVPAATYKVSCGTLTIPSNTQIVGEGDGTIFAVPSGSTGMLFTATTVNNIGLSDFQVTSANDDTIVLWAGTVTNLKMHNITCLGACLILSGTNAALPLATMTYSAINAGNSNYDWNISDNRGVAVAVGTNRRALIECNWLNRAVIKGNNANGYFNGIWFWGGDSNFANDGVITNARKASDIIISENIVLNCDYPQAQGGGAGIAGSMGLRITIANNNVKLCGDVGIDCEGCFDTTVTGNQSWDAKNGALTIFFGSQRYMAVGNTLGNTGTNVILFRIYNSDVDNINSDGLTLRANTFVSLSGIGVVDDNSGPSGNTIISDCTFQNATINFSNNSAGVTIINNRFHYTATLAAHNTIYLHVLSVNETVNTIAGNTVMCEAAQNAATIFIKMLSDDFNLPVTYLVENNKNCAVNPIVTDIAIAEAGTNSGVSGLYLIRGNLLTGTTHLTRSETGSKASIVRWTDNYDKALLPWPAAIPTLLRWDVGTRIFYPAPTASAFIGAVCVTAGVPGTWKTWGATSA